MNLQQIILKLQFLGDSKKVSLPINSSLVPSPKVHTQTPRVKPLPLIFRQLLLHWVVLQNQISLKSPCRGEVTG